MGTYVTKRTYTDGQNYLCTRNHYNNYLLNL